jgi:non-heme chloroperoxidase
VLPLPISALKSSSPVLLNPANRNRAVPLTFEQFRYSFANAVSEEAKRPYEDLRCRLRRVAVPGRGG